MTYSAPAERPYDAAASDTEPETPGLDQVLSDALRVHALGLRVALPVKVAAVQGNQKVDVQPMLQARYHTEDGPTDMPIIKGVPVALPMGKNYLLKVPIAEGDSGLVVFCDRSIDAWSASQADSPVDPQDTRAHDLSDAVFFPGVVPFPLQTTDDTDDLVLSCGDAQLRLLQSGKVLAGSKASGGQELLDLLNQVLQNQIDILNTLATNTLTLTMLGPQPFIASTVLAFNTLKTTAQSIQQNLGTLKT